MGQQPRIESRWFLYKTDRDDDPETRRENKSARQEEQKYYEQALREEREVERRLEAIDNPDKNLHSLRDIFPDYQFKETAFPDTQDFINMPFGTAFCRMERAENLHVFKTIKAPEPTAGIRGQVLHAMREQYGIQAKPAEPVRPIAVQPAERPATDTETVEDFKRILEEAVTGERIDETPPNDPPPVRTSPQASEPPAPDPFAQKEPPKRRQRKPKPKKDQLSF